MQENDNEWQTASFHNKHNPCLCGLDRLDDRALLIIRIHSDGLSVLVSNARQRFGVLASGLLLEDVDGVSVFHVQLQKTTSAGLVCRQQTRQF